MIDKAIAKITEEMMKTSDPTIQCIEEYLTKICTTADIAEKLLDPGKNIKGAVNVMREVARKRAVHGAGCVPPEEGFRIVDEYFGITEEMKSRAKQDQDTINILDLI